MPSNPNIALGLRPIELPDQMAQIGQVMSLRSLIDQGDLHQLQRRKIEQDFADQDSYRAAAIEAGNDPSRLSSILLQRGLPKQALEAGKLQLETQGKRLEMEKNQAEIDKRQLEAVGGVFSQFAGKPDLSHEDVARGFGMLEASGVPKERITKLAAAVPQDPAKLREYSTWIATQTAHGLSTLEKLAPKVDMKDVGGSLVPVNTNTLAGPVGPLAGAAPIAKTLSPEGVQTGAHQKVMEGQGQQNINLSGARLGLERQRLNLDALSNPIEVTGPDGRQILVQQNKQTGQLVDVNTKQPVAGVAPKMDAATETNLRDVRKLSGTLDSMIQNFKPEYVGVTGRMGEASDQYLTQIPGMSGLVGNPDRVTFRQLSATVLNNYISAVTGATVGQGGEQQRLMRAVPAPGDSALVFESKMKQMRKNLDELPAIIANNPAVSGKPVAPAPDQRATPRGNVQRKIVDY